MLVDSTTTHSQPLPGQECSKLYFVELMKSIGNLQAEKNPVFNDVVVVCGQGQSKKQYRVPAIVVAAISPVFKVTINNSTTINILLKAC